MFGRWLGGVEKLFKSLILVGLVRFVGLYGIVEIISFSVKKNISLLAVCSSGVSLAPYMVPTLQT